jgi:hypothetical protein
VWKEVLSSPPPVIAIGKTFSEQRSQVTTDGDEKKEARTQTSGKSTTSVKVDVVANNGHTWIRVNTHVMPPFVFASLISNFSIPTISAKNSRLLAEFRELDSYLTDSDSEGDSTTSDDMAHSSRAQLQTEFDNSLLRTARALLAAARDNPVFGTSTPPKIVFRLTRIDPDATDECGNDPRIALTIESLRKMGLSIQLGERGSIKQLADSTPALPALPALIPTHQINLDLSILIALVSDLTHARLPTSVDAAHERFIPSAAYVEWKRSRLRVKSGGYNDSTNALREDSDDLFDTTQHSRALAEQLQQEMHKGIFQEIHERLLSLRGQLSRDGPTCDSVLNAEGAPPHVEFWTTPEARDRFLRIVSKVGGPGEKRRASALFPSSPVDSGSGLGLSSLAEQEAQYWAHSRYPRGLLPLLPIRVFPTPEPATPSPPPPCAGFFGALEATCRALLAAGGALHPRALEAEGVGEREGDIQRASVVRTNARLTTHTVHSMLCGATRGWTTLTANRASVKVMVREMRMRGYGAVDVRGRGAGGENHAAIALWVIDPRSLAEGMRSDFVGSAPG